MAIGSAENRAKAVQDGAMAAIVSAIGAHQKDADVQARAVNAVVTPVSAAECINQNQLACVPALTVPL